MNEDSAIQCMTILSVYVRNQYPMKILNVHDLNELCLFLNWFEDFLRTLWAL